MPLPSGNALFGSDVVAETLRALEIPFIALNPGSSYRGLHDSLVNHLGNVQPQMLLCLHEEHAVAIAHGYAKVTGRPMAAAVHSNVGLMHATMAMFNAWCDRMPVLLLGATGPVDAPKRRPWIDWIHTARDQGALIRDYTKWDDQPASAEAAREALLRACWLARSAPKGPVYVNLDAGMQEAPLADPLPPIDVSRFVPDVVSAVAPEQVAQAVAMLRAAKQPVILMGRGSRGEQEWANRVALAETLRARVVTDLKCAAVFPTDHPLHVGAPATFPVQEAAQAIAAADVILSLDWVDLAGALKAACGTVSPAAKVINVTLDHQLHNGWSMDHQALPPADLFIAADARYRGRGPARATAAAERRAPIEPRRRRRSRRSSQAQISVAQMTHALRQAVGARPASLLHMSLSWNAALWPFRHPLDYIGCDRRRRDRRRAGHRRRRGAGTARQRPAAGRGLRRRRLPDGRHRAVDGGALQHSAAGGGRQQPLVLQRRTASGARGADAQPAGGESLDRPADRRSGDRSRAACPARRARWASVRSPTAPIWRRHSATRSRRWTAAPSRWWMCASHPAMRRPRSPGCSAHDGLLVCAVFRDRVAEQVDSGCPTSIAATPDAAAGR